MMGGGAILGVAALFFGGVIDYFVTVPFFMSLIAGTSFADWNPLTVFLLVYGVPYAVSVAAVSAVIGTIAGGS